MPTLKRFDTNKAIFASRLLKVWEKLPDLTFSELLQKIEWFPAMPDNDLIEALERLALLS